MIRMGKYRAGLSERLGYVAKRIVRRDARPVIWLHAVSVGEVLAIQGLVAGIRAALPSYRIVVSTTTHTGQKVARGRFGDGDVFYFPIDLSICILPYLRALKPKLVILAETEFWPNFLRSAKKSGARVAVVNARISDRSLPRYRRFRGLLSHALEFIDVFLAQSEEDARRLLAIGAPPERVLVSGNLKFDVKPPEEVPIVSRLRGILAREQATPVIVAGSTVEGEEELVVDAFRFLVLERHPQAVLVLAPRHKERFEDVAFRLEQSGVRHSRRSQMSANTVLAGSVLLLDSLGELASVYALADVAFVGGSLVPRGGHNILEPAHWGVATIVGPHTENFRDIIGIFRQSKAVCVATKEEFGPALLSLVSNDEERRTLGERAREVVRQQAGVTQRTIAEMRARLGGAK